MEYWRTKILEQEREYTKRCEDRLDWKVKGRQTAFEKGYAALRAKEEADNVPVEERVIIYNPEEKYCELLSQIEEQSTGRCFSCDGTKGDEIKVLPCEHQVHDSCFKTWYEAPLREELQCPVCDRKFNVLVMPKFRSTRIEFGHDPRVPRSYVPFLGTDREKANAEEATVSQSNVA